MYDTLVSAGQTDEYPQVVSKMSTYSSIATGFASISGGFLFLLHPGFPWYLTSLAKLTCVFIAILMIEPAVDTFKVSFENVRSQFFVGFRQLFSSKVFWLSLFILSFGIFSKVNSEILDDTNVIEFGLNSAQIGTFFAVLLISSVPFSLFYHRLQKIISPLYLMIGSMLIYGIILAAVPFVSLPVFLLIVTFRASLSTIRTNSVSQIINQVTPSAIRTTTLSTVELINTIPFVLFSYPIGLFMKMYSARAVTSVIGFLIIFILSVQVPGVISRFRHFGNATLSS